MIRLRDFFQFLFRRFLREVCRPLLYPIHFLYALRLQLLQFQYMYFKLISKLTFSFPIYYLKAAMHVWRFLLVQHVICQDIYRYGPRQLVIVLSLFQVCEISRPVIDYPFCHRCQVVYLHFYVNLLTGFRFSKYIQSRFLVFGKLTIYLSINHLYIRYLLCSLIFQKSIYKRKRYLRMLFKNSLEYRIVSPVQTKSSHTIPSFSHHMPPISLHIL